MKKEDNRFSNKINIKNRKASFEFELLSKYEAGLVLKGTEIKSIREGKASLQEAYCYVFKNELFVKNMHITEYKQGSFTNHQPDRDRKLLLKSSELVKLEAKTKEKGLSIIPLRLFINQRGFAKLEIALAKGKKIYDKRDSIREKDMKKQLSKINY